MRLDPETANIKIPDQEGVQNQEIAAIDEIAIDPVQDLGIVNVPLVIAPDQENQEKSVEGREAEKEKEANAVKAKNATGRRRLKGNTN